MQIMEDYFEYFYKGTKHIFEDKFHIYNKRYNTYNKGTYKSIHSVFR